MSQHFFIIITFCDLNTKDLPILNFLETYSISFHNGTKVMSIMNCVILHDVLFLNTSYEGHSICIENRFISPKYGRYKVVWGTVRKIHLSTFRRNWNHTNRFTNGWDIAAQNYLPNLPAKCLEFLIKFNIYLKNSDFWQNCIRNLDLK